MEYIKINKLLKTSIYKQIAASISDAIDSGELKYNDRLPTEKEICQIYSISQTAVKMAYESLIQDGKIKRIKGKGTYVTNRETHFDQLRAYYAYDFEPDQWTKEIVMIDRLSYDYSAYRALKMESGEKCYRMVIVIKKNNNPILFQKIYLPKKMYPDFDKKFNKEKQLYRLIENEYNYKIKQIHSTYSPINASSAEALLLRIQPDDAIYFIRTKLIDMDDRIIGYVCHYFPGEFTEFEVTVNAI